MLRYSLLALAGNLAVLLVMSAVAGIPCEWLLRRHPLRWHFSLRTMIAAVGLLAAFFAWCAALRHRADAQDAFLADLEDEELSVDFDFERWGPQWLGLVLDDRIRRRVVGASLWEPDAEVLQRLTQLPNLSRLVVPGADWTTDSAAALGEMRRLRNVRVAAWHDQHDERSVDELVGAIAKLQRLEVLRLDGVAITSDRLGRIANLKRLKALQLHPNYSLVDLQEERMKPLGSSDKWAALAGLPVLPRLEAIGFHWSLVYTDDIRRLAALPRLTALDLTDSYFADDTALTELVSLQSLEELAIGPIQPSAQFLESLVSLNRLKVLHFYYPQYLGGGEWKPPSHPAATLPLDDGAKIFVRESEVDHCRRALLALLSSNPGMLIDNAGSDDNDESFDQRHGFHEKLDWDKYLMDQYPTTGWGYF
ncbi:MAG TPA: hypothetical protein VFI31_15550 [Pirellulales bacterium]|nr:hypothetical protein [Pirellulales bacterium]